VQNKWHLCCESWFLKLSTFKDSSGFTTKVAVPHKLSILTDILDYYYEKCCFLVLLFSYTLHQPSGGQKINYKGVML